MTISEGDKRLLFQCSGNRCAFPGCLKTLTFEDAITPVISISEIAHIVAQREDGPRGTYHLPLDQRDNYENLILLCEEHHHIVDSNAATYPVEMLKRWKTQHEKRIQQATNKPNSLEINPFVSEQIHSNLLPVAQMPRHVFSATVISSPGGILIRPVESNLIVAYVIRGERLFTFTDLKHPQQPFGDHIDKESISQDLTNNLLSDPDRYRLFVDLLNKSLIRFTRKKGLSFDRNHHRYFFAQKQHGKPLEVKYQPLNQAKVLRQVVWQPITRKTGIPKNYWLHRAVGLRFILINNTQWCLSIRPELHITVDGNAPYPSEYRGRKITKRLSRSFNYDFLGDLQFWRNYLSGNYPRILLPFGGGQFIEIKNRLIESIVLWPGMPEQHARSFRNVQPLESLDSLLELAELTSPDDSDDFDWPEINE